MGMHVECECRWGVVTIRNRRATFECDLCGKEIEGCYVELTDHSVILTPDEEYVITADLRTSGKLNKS